MQNIPIGISNYETIRTNDYYYVDKTEMIHELLNGNQNAVTLITRPRRFGKTLAMSMLANFFDIRKEASHLFEGLKIEKDEDLCKKWMNQYPTIFLTFKDVEGMTFSSAKEMLVTIISSLCKQYSFLLDSEEVDKYDKKDLEKLMDGNLVQDSLLKTSILLLTRMLKAYYDKPVILLLDEYDVPLAKASLNGYYKEMLEIMKTMMSTSLKDNSNLQLAVVTGCLQISKESIFTGTNNFISNTISKNYFNEYFGFTNDEVKALLEEYNLVEDTDIVKNWYDGYRFGDKDIYCPWDVLNYVYDVRKSNISHNPTSYWKNTSDNAIVRMFIDERNQNIKDKIEKLLDDQYILEKIEEDVTYNFDRNNDHNFWSVLYLSGYLTKCNEEEITEIDAKKIKNDNLYALKIPNAEIKEIYQDTILKWFNDSVVTWDLNKLYTAVWNKDIDVITEELNRILLKTISYQDYKEDFYHAFLAGIFTGAGYNVESNREHGIGRSDIVITNPDTYDVVIFEVKHVKQYSKLEQECDKAIEQIQSRKYSEDFKLSHKKILEYGICFYKKTCLVKSVDKKVG